MNRAPAHIFAVVLVTAAVGLTACDDEDQTTTTDAATEAGCKAVEAPPPTRIELKKPTVRIKAGEKLTAAVETSCGRFEIALDARAAPRAVSSFVHMAEEGVYDGTVFSRIVPGFLIQGGDPTGTGDGDAGYFVDEPPPPDTEYTLGTVAMSKSGVEPPGRSGSQFFVVTVADAGLPADYALLGKISRGLTVVDRIGELGDPASGEEGTPLATVVIQSVTIKGA